MSSTPLWFGPENRALFGWLHLPDSGTARALTILAPPIGIEATHSYANYRLLAERLENLGFAALRFDYDGTGDSFGSEEDPGRLDAWLNSLTEALSLARSLEAPRIGLVGMRMGALLAAVSTLGQKPDFFVAWDPCVSGREFLREQRLVLDVVSGGLREEVGFIEALGTAFEEASANAIRSLRWPRSSEDRPRRALVLTRDERKGDREDLTKLGWGWAEFASLPKEDAFESIAAWIDKAATKKTAVIKPLLNEPRASFDWGEGSIRETAQRLSPYVFGIVTEPEARASGPTLVFLSTGVNYRIGPGRLWVNLARSLAVQGLRCARVDLSGIGDSGVRPGQPRQRNAPPEALADLEDIARALQPDDPRQVIPVGVCIGGYHALEAALRLNTVGVCAINPVTDFNLEQPASRTLRRAVRPRRWLVRTLDRMPFATAVGRHIPTSVWWLLDRVGIQPSPAQPLREVARMAERVLVMCCPEDAAPFTKRGKWVLEHLLKNPSFNFVVDDRLDHLLWTRRSRSAAAELIREFLGPYLKSNSPEPSSSYKRAHSDEASADLRRSRYERQQQAHTA
jgi:pimeloyl-ACP methyl ester carboxylesterase